MGSKVRSEMVPATDPPNAPMSVTAPVRGFTATRWPAKPKAGDEFDHSSRLAVVDKQGNIRGYFDGLRVGSTPESEADFIDNLNQLRTKVAELRTE